MTMQSADIGCISVTANDIECFTWKGTRQEATELQKRYLDEAPTLYTVNPHSAAKRAAGYLMVYGMPHEGADDMRPSGTGKWTLAEVEVCKRAILWLALR